MSYEEITRSEGKHFAAIHDPEAAGLCPTPRAQILMGHHWAIGAALCKGNHRTPGKHAIKETKMDSFWVFNIFFLLLVVHMFEFRHYHCFLEGAQ